MKMENRKTKVCVLFLAILVCGFLSLYFFAGSGGGGNVVIAEAAQMLTLVSPAFAQNATASTTTFLDEEAGISLYTDMNQSLDLSKAKTAFKTIEKETSQYIVGSVSLPDLPESDDVHCFVHIEGWIVVYYLNEEPVSKIIDWNHYLAGKLTKTKLQLGLDVMCIALGVTATDINYYHFHHPYANKFMIIIDLQQGEGTDSFNLKIPSELLFYERSWSHRGGGGTATMCGFLTATQLTPDTFHTVEAYVYYYWGTGYDSYLNLDGETISHIDDASTSEVGIALVYKEP